MSLVRAAFGLLWAGGLCLGAGCVTPRQPPLESLDREQTLSMDEQTLAFSEALAHYSQAHRYELERDLDAAVASYRQAAERDPDNEELYYRMAMVLLQQKKTEEAIAIMEDICSRHPESGKALLWLGLIYRAADQPDRAEATYLRLIDAAPRLPTAYGQLAMLYVKQDRPQEALDLLIPAVRRVKEPVSLHKLLGEINIRLAAEEEAADAAGKRRQAAIRHLEEVARLDPEDVGVLYQLGDLHILEGKLKPAIEYFQQIEQRHPNDLRIKQRLARSFVAVGDKDKAVQALEAIAREQPSNPRVYFYLAELYDQLGRKDLAVTNYGLATKAMPEEPAAYLRKALLQMDEEPDRAVETLGQGLDYLPGHPALTEMLAYAYLAGKHYEQACTQFGTALEILEERNQEGELKPSFHFNHALAAHHAGRLDEAGAILARAVTEGPGYLDAYVQYVTRQQDADVRRDALEVLRGVSRRLPGEPAIHYYIGLFHHYDDNFSAAIEAFEQAEKLALDEDDEAGMLHEQFYFFFAAVCERAGDYGKAEEKFGRCLELDPDNAEAHNYIAYMWAEQGLKLDQAEEHVRKALDIEPENGAFVDTLGWIYYRKGRYPEALEEIGRAHGLMPEDPTVMEHLGDALWALERKEEAVSRWKESFVIEPDNEGLSAKLAREGVALDPLREKAEERKTALAAEAAAEPDLPHTDETPTAD